ncbi:MAG TPA: Gfo/Idh/MocA family oxidoreductase [Chthonomonadaceae bacterium]|nr:Gfo/Idh/MocA family oxidoreductase [Chthonomonadaceae bacterium]
MNNTRYRYAIVGTGREHGTEGATGFGMAHPHIRAFQGTGRTELIAIAEPNADNARHFLEKHEQPNATVYSGVHAMLAAETPDIASVCTWPHLHAEITVALCEAGVRAVHCEKPMATTWGDAKRMKAAASASGTILTFDHQRRFLEPFQATRKLLVDGAIGELQRMEANCSDLCDWGTHWIDMLFFFNGETPAEWVLGQIDSRNEKRIFGAFAEEQGLSHIKFANGVRATVTTGFEANTGQAIRLYGSEGAIEIGWDSKIRLRGPGDADWRIVPTAESIHGGEAIPRAAADLILALDQPNHKPLLTVDNALRTTEVIFATWESSRRRGRVDLPLQQEDSALLAMLAAGQIGPGRAAIV